MCIIAICEGRLPSHDDLRRATAANSDGLGLAWIQGGKVHWRKGYEEPDEVLALARTLPMPLVIHARLASVGEASPPLCHPFPLEKDVPLTLQGSTPHGVLFHNGHWSEWKQMALLVAASHGTKVPPGPWSDTRAMAFILAHLGLPAATLLGEHKLAILTPQGVTHLGTGWLQERGIKWSNAGYKGAERRLFTHDKVDQAYWRRFIRG